MAEKKRRCLNIGEEEGERKPLQKQKSEETTAKQHTSFPSRCSSRGGFNTEAFGFGEKRPAKTTGIRLKNSQITQNEIRPPSFHRCKSPGGVFIERKLRNHH